MSNNKEISISISRSASIKSPVNSDEDELLNTSFDDQIYFALPDINLTDSQDVEVSESHALRCLDEALQSGLVTNNNCIYLRNKYLQVFKALQLSRTNAFLLLKQSKSFEQELEIQNMTLLHADEFPENVSTEASQLREEMLLTQNKFTTCNEEYNLLHEQIEMLKLEKRLFECDLVDLPQKELDALDENANIIEYAKKRRKDLLKQIKDLRIEIEFLENQSKKLKDNLKFYTDQHNEIENELVVVEKEMEETKSALIVCQGTTSDLQKETDRLRRYIQNCEKELGEKQATIQAIVEEINNYEEELVKYKNDEEDLQEENDKIAKAIENVKSEIEKLNFTIIKNDEEIMLEKMEKATLTLLFLFETRYRKNKLRRKEKKEAEYNLLLKEIEVANMKLKREEHRYEDVYLLYDKFLEKFENMANKSELSTAILQKKALHQIQILQEIIKQETLKQEDLLNETQVLEKSAENSIMILNEKHVNLQETTQSMTMICDERDRRIKEFVSTEYRINLLCEEIKHKDHLLMDLKKSLEDVKQNLCKFAKLYDIMRMERNQCVTALHSTNGILMDLKEKYGLLANEYEIFTHNVPQINQKYLKIQQKLDSSIKQRDQLRFQLSKQNEVLIEQDNRRCLLRSDIKRLHMEVNQVESLIMQIKKQKQRTELLRKSLTIQVIESNEEVYILQEKVRVQNLMIEQAELETQSRKEEYDILKLQKLHELHDLEVLHKKLPQKNQLEVELCKLQKEYDKIHAERCELERKAENPFEYHRIRFLADEKLSDDELKKKLKKLEKILISREEYLLEKELLYEAVCRLVEKVQFTADYCKKSDFNLATIITKYKRTIHDVNKKLRCNLAEFTLIQTNHNEHKMACKELHRKLETVGSMSDNKTVSIDKRKLQENTIIRELPFSTKNQFNKALLQQIVKNDQIIKNAEQKLSKKKIKHNNEIVHINSNDYLRLPEIKQIINKKVEEKIKNYYFEKLK